MKAAIPSTPPLQDRQHRYFLEALRQHALETQRTLTVAASTAGQGSAALSAKIAALTQRVTALEIAIASLTSGDIIDITAGESLPAYSPFWIDTDGLAYAPSTSEELDLVLGLTEAAIGSGVNGKGRIGGVLEMPDASLTIGSVQYADGDSITEIKPTSGVFVQVGKAISTTQLVVEVRAGTVQVRSGNDVALMQTRSDGVVDPSMAVIGPGNSPNGIYTGQEGEAFIFPFESGVSDALGIDGDGWLIEF